VDYLTIEYGGFGLMGVEGSSLEITNWNHTIDTDSKQLYQ